MWRIVMDFIGRLMNFRSIYLILFVWRKYFSDVFCPVQPNQILVAVASDRITAVKKMIIFYMTFCYSEVCRFWYKIIFSSWRIIYIYIYIYTYYFWSERSTSHLIWTQMNFDKETRNLCKFLRRPPD